MSVLKARVRNRRNDASDADVTVLQRQLAFDLGPVGWPYIDASAVPDEIAAATRRQIDLNVDS